jgi:hypothetical protein
MNEKAKFRVTLTTHLSAHTFCSVDEIKTLVMTRRVII